MSNKWTENWLNSRTRVGWVELKQATPDTYAKMGFKCGLEVHQQLLTQKKLFCRCKAGIYHDFDNFDAEIVRHMRPTLSELGEYDGTALMEFRTRKKIVYRIKNDSACTYEVDDTPPFLLNREALSHAMQIALLLKMNIVGELHITRKQYLDGSIPTGFQRTTILGIEGSFPIRNKVIRVIQFSIEEDSCREVSDIRHTRVYFADRLGMPLIETVTYPDMLTPQEAAEAGQYIRFLARSSGKARVGIGAARQDVNVSVTGGTRIEIKGVAHISWIPKLTHNEAYRQISLLEIKKDLNERVQNPEKWNTNWVYLSPDEWKHIPALKAAAAENWKLIVINLPEFKNILSFFTQPGRTFASELEDRLKVIACLEKPNMYHSEELEPELTEADWSTIASQLDAGENDAQILLWTPEDDLKTAVETITERCQLAFSGIPGETRKSMPDGTTLFERVLPGPDRMYPDTDSAPISIHDEMIEEARQQLPIDLHERMKQLIAWNVPEDAFAYILRNNLMPVIERISAEQEVSPRFLCLLYAHHLKSMQGRNPLPFGHDRIEDMLKFIKARKLTTDILPLLMEVLFVNPNMEFSSILTVIGYKNIEPESIYEQIPVLHDIFKRNKSNHNPDAETNWIMGRLKKIALGNIPMKDLRTKVEDFLQKEVAHA
ncbi:MAG TPA: Glu-tRNA(Gln) amidotransferase subunit GatE [Candidatus Cloacimonadota bacterium]|nr:Glu-tRNA(Gln) amidotransferase subunit GatE [Candidatus Cloacimonadota bacterium]HPT72852.1 Glu-tRNA(Gln) amidotransferase subunit GatE [Candidatus Cloacimonadota bacterium]